MLRQIRHSRTRLDNNIMTYEIKICVRAYDKFDTQKTIRSIANDLAALKHANGVV